MVVGICNQALATRIQPPPDRICDSSQVELLAGVITGFERAPESLRVYLQSDWGTNETMDLPLSDSNNANPLSQRSLLQTTDLTNWLMLHGQNRLIRVWTCTETASQLWEVLDTTK